VSPGFLANLRAPSGKATNNRWNQWVLNYSQAKQMDLLAQHRLQRAGLFLKFSLYRGIF